MAWINVPQAPGAARANTVRAKAGDTRNWYSIRNATSADEAALYLYDEVGGWFGATAEQFVSDLSAVTSPSLRVHVNSPGGSVFEGLAIANALRAHPANVTVQVDGLAASIASVIAMAADRIEMAPQSMLMIHEASGVCLGDSAEMAKMAEVLDIISDNISDAYAAKAGGTAAEWREAMRAESWYKAADAVAAGLADVALPTGGASEDDVPEQMAARFDPAAYGYAGPAQPKPGPPHVKAQQEQPAPIALTISLGDAIGEQIAEAVRAAVAAPETAASEPVGTGQDEAPAAGPEDAPPTPEPAAPIAEMRGEHGPELVAIEPDSWADAFAALTTPGSDSWAAAFAVLTTGPASSSATES
jgi:ATP-dependent protease ClpP protease subunit